MSGHSKWAGIKHKKAAIDKKKGKLWTKVVREITMAAKIGGGKEDANPRLRKAIEDAKAANMPADNIKRAIQKGTGEIPGVVYEELTFEGYGPGGVAIYCEGTTDNRNRTTNEVRQIFENNGGNMGSSGSVAFLFDRKGYLTLKRSAIAEDALLDLALEAGADDLKADDAELYEITCDPFALDKVSAALKAKGLALESAVISMIPKTSVPLDAAAAPKVLELIDALEEYDDIAEVHANFDITDEVLASLEK